MSVEASEQPDPDSEYIRERAGTRLVNQKHVDEYDFDIGRQHGGQSHLLTVNEPGSPGCLGNPHPVKEHGECDVCEDYHTREQSIRAFRDDFQECLEADPAFREWVESLEGQTLACYCVPEYCHGDVILEFLDRGDDAFLRWENQRLRDRVDELESIVTEAMGPAFASFVNNVNNEQFTDGDDAPGYANPRIAGSAAKAARVLDQRGDRLESVETTLQRHESEIEQGRTLASDKQGEHWQRVVETAQNVADMQSHALGDDWVILYKDDIASSTTIGETRAGQLIDEWTDTDSGKYKQGTEKQPYRPPAKRRNGNAQRKALKIDLKVWGESDA